MSDHIMLSLGSDPCSVSAFHSEEKPGGVAVAYEAVFSLNLSSAVLPALGTACPLSRCLWSCRQTPRRTSAPSAPRPPLASRPYLLQASPRSRLLDEASPERPVQFCSLPSAPFNPAPTLLFSIVLVFQQWYNFLPVMFMASCQSPPARL